MTKEEFLRKVQFTAGLSDAEIEAIATLLHRRHVKKGDIIFKEGETSAEIFLIEKGRVNIMINPSDFREAAEERFITLFDGDIFGEFAFIDGAVRSATVVAEEDTDLYYINYIDFHRFLDENEHVGYVVMKNIARNLTGKLRSMNLELRNLII